MNEWDSIVSSGRTYGSCIHSTTKSTVVYKKHIIAEGETLQGIALKYGISTEELRRVNKLYSSDSLFLRKDLSIPSSFLANGNNTNNETKSNLEVGKNDDRKNSKASKKNSEDSFSNEDAKSFLQKLDSQISAGKKAVKEFKSDPIEEAASNDLDVNGAMFYDKDSYQKKHLDQKLSQQSDLTKDNLFQL